MIFFQFSLFPEGVFYGEDRSVSSFVRIEITTIDDDDDEQLVGRLLIPAVTDLVVADCGYLDGETRLELDVPSLQYFRYIQGACSANQ
jgi:hypothetical protein